MKSIQYHNDINKLKLGGFTENETDIFFGILLKTKETQSNILTLKFTELKNLIDVKHRNNNRFIENIKTLNIKLKMLLQEIELPNGDFKLFSLFDDITTSPSRNLVEIEINKNFRYMVDNLMENYTIIDLKQLVSLRGSYAKVLYRLLKQFETSNLYVVKIQDFRELMGIPDTYLMKNIRQKVLKPCLEQLNQFFDGLELEEIKTGRNVSSLKFTWKRKKKEIVKIKSPIKYKSSHGEKEHIEWEKEVELNLEKDNEVEVTKEKISKNEFERMVQELMDKNNVKDSFSKRGFEHQLSLKYDVVGDIPQEQEKKVISIDEYKKILRNKLVHNHSFNILEIKEFEKEFLKHTNVKGFSIIGDDGGFALLDYNNILNW